MGMTPRELDSMTLWEFRAAVTAWKKFHAHVPEDDKPPEMSDDRLRELGIVGFN